jgi:hypothetical protein
MKNKRIVLYSLIILAGVINFPVLARQKNGDKTVVYQLDIKKSKLFWNAHKNEHNGFILFNSGTLSNFIDGWPTQGTFSINMNSIRSTDETSATGRKRVEEELKSPAFFTVPKYPAATIVVSRILPESNKTTFSLYGELTIKEVTKPIEFTAVMKQNGNTITATANINITRANWHTDPQQGPKSWNLFDGKDKHIDEQIPVRLELVFTKK